MAYSLKEGVFVGISQMLNDFFGGSVPQEERRVRMDLAIKALDEDLGEGIKFATSEIGLKDGDVAPFFSSWISANRGQNFWPSLPAGFIGAEVRTGFLEALTVARDHGLPLRLVVDGGGELKVRHVVRANEVKVTFFIPPIEGAVSAE